MEHGTKPGKMTALGEQSDITVLMGAKSRPMAPSDTFQGDAQSLVVLYYFDVETQEMFLCKFIVMSNDNRREQLQSLACWTTR